MVIAAFKYFFFYMFFCFQLCYGKSEQSEAISHIQKAAYSYPVVKSYAKKAEKTLYQFLPMSRKNAAIVGSVAMTAVSGKINTGRIKKINIDFFGGNMRPDLVYDFRSSHMSALVSINWSWE